MEKWIVPCNVKYYDVNNAFNKLKKLDWKQSCKSINIGDEVYIYVGKPYSAIKYRCVVNKVNIESIEIDDSEFVIDGSPYENYHNYMELELLEVFADDELTIDVLRDRGLKGNIQSPRCASNLL